MTYIHHCLLKTSLFIIAIVSGGLWLRGPLSGAFAHNVWLNGVILGAFIVGVVWAYKRLFSLMKEKKWLDALAIGEEKFPGVPQPSVLKPLQTYLAHNGASRHQPVAITMLLDSVDARLEDTRDVSRYLIGLMIFLGLLGTFWGLSQTIGAITGIISGIDVGAADIRQSFDVLKQGLQSPLAGMGTAFSCSMFGLAASMILGFLEVHLSKAGVRFFYDFEEKLAELLRVETVSVLTEDTDVFRGGQAYTSSLMEQNAETLSRLLTVLQGQEDGRSNALKLTQTVAEKLTLLTEQMTVQQHLLQKIAQSHVDLQSQLYAFSKTVMDQQAHSSLNEGLKEYLRNLDTTTLRILEEMIEGRAQGVQDIRGEIRLVAKTISALAHQEAA